MSTPLACQVALQRILCGNRCANPESVERGKVPGGTCWPNDGYSGAVIYSPCDDGKGFCPAPDCVWYGACVCLCHRF